MSQVLLSDLLPPDRIKIPIRSSDKTALIEEMCGFLSRACGAGEEEAREIEEAVLAREAVLSTGIGGGVAVPHGKSEAVDELVLVAGRTAAPVDFEALDGEPVRLVMLLVGPDSAAGLHVQVLSRISRLLRTSDLRDALVGARSAAEFHAALREAERK